MITGANSGIGKAAAHELARRGATVHLICRNRESGQQAQREITACSNNPNVYLHIVDMSQPRQVAKFANEFAKSGMRLTTLINNAGVMVNERKCVEGELEVNFATNTLGTHILTKTLIPVLAQAYKPRIVNKLLHILFRSSTQTCSSV